MKRHHQRQAQQILTLGLLGSLALLTACGGGGKGGGAAAAPAAVEAKDPSVIEVADANEPYLAAASAFSTKVMGYDDKGNAIYANNGYVLKVFDGITQEVRYEFNLGTQSNADLWRVLPEQSGGDAFTIASGNATAASKTVNGRVVFVQDGKLLQFNLKRSATSSTAQQLSGLTNVCSIREWLPLNVSNTKSAVLVNTAGSDSICGNTNDKLAVVTTEMTAASPSLTPVAQDFKVIRSLFADDGAPLGVLVQNKTGPASAQLALWNASLDTAKTPTIKLIKAAADISTFMTSGDDINFTAQWVVGSPKTLSSGYVRIRDNATTSPSLFKVSIDGTGGAIAEQTDLALQNAPVHMGIQDGADVYIVNGKYIVKNIASDLSGLTFESVLGSGSYYGTLTGVTLKGIYQSSTNLLMHIETGIKEQYLYAVNKSTAKASFVNYGQVGDAFEFLGLNGENVYVSRIGDYAGARNVIRTDMALLGGITSHQDPVLKNIIRASVQKNNTQTRYGQSLSSVVVCQLSSPLDENCLGKTLKLFNTATNTLTNEVGAISATNASDFSITGDGLSGYSNVLMVTKQRTNGDKYSDVWTFHPGAPRSLKEPKALPAPVTPPASAAV